ncbi:MAG: N-acetyltransferase [Prevotellaceae bacterium]|nr:N-acetyltransferase [Prevotellaceae bacterium]
MDAITIRPVRADDAAALAAIYNPYVAETDISFETEPLTAGDMRQRIAQTAASCPYLVAEAGGTPVGYCYAHPWKERAAYALTLETTVYIDRRHCGRGIGRRLMERLIDDCRQRGAHALVACITGGNARSTALHEALGFRRVSRFRQVGRKGGRWLDVEDYELLLAE